MHKVGSRVRRFFFVCWRDFNLNVHAYTNALALAARCPIRFWLARNVNMDIKFCVAAAKGIFIIESINCSVSDAVA